MHARGGRGRGRGRGRGWGRGGAGAKYELAFNSYFIRRSRAVTSGGPGGPGPPPPVKSWAPSKKLVCPIKGCLLLCYVRRLHTYTCTVCTGTCIYVQISCTVYSDNAHVHCILCTTVYTLHNSPYVCTVHSTYTRKGRFRVGRICDKTGNALWRS